MDSGLFSASATNRGAKKRIYTTQFSNLLEVVKLVLAESFRSLKFAISSVY